MINESLVNQRIIKKPDASFILSRFKTKQAFIFDAFTPEGKFIGRVEIVEPKISLRDRVTKWHGKAVWVRQSDPEGKSSIIQFLVESR